MITGVVIDVMSVMVTDTVCDVENVPVIDMVSDMVIDTVCDVGSVMVIVT